MCVLSFASFLSRFCENKNFIAPTFFNPNMILNIEQSHTTKSIKHKSQNIVHKKSSFSHIHRKQRQLLSQKLDYSLMPTERLMEGMFIQVKNMFAVADRYYTNGNGRKMQFVTWLLFFCSIFTTQLLIPFLLKKNRDICILHILCCCGISQ